MAGYEPETKQTVLYSGGIERFRPNEKGEAKVVINCGDHGDQSRDEWRYDFDQPAEKFKLFSESHTLC